MKHLHRLSKLTLTLSLAASAIVMVPNTALANHSVGVKAGGGGVDYKGKDTDGQGLGEVYAFYQYKFMPMFSIEIAGVAAGDIDIWDCEKDTNSQWQCSIDDDEFSLQADKLTYNGAIAALVTEVRLTKRNSLYAKAGAIFYNYEMKLDGDVIADDDGTGLVMEAGWQYRWDNGIGLNFGFHKRDMGDLETAGSSVGLSYSF